MDNFVWSDVAWIDGSTMGDHDVWSDVRYIHA